MFIKKVLLSLLLLNFTLFAEAQNYNRYCNSAFPFCADIPGNFNRVGKSKTGDGQYFTGKDGSTLSIYGAFNTENENLKDRFDREEVALTSDSAVANSTQIPTIEKAAIEGNTYTIVYQNQSFTNLIYRKLEDNTWFSIEIRYPIAKSKEYELKVKKDDREF